MADQGGHHSEMITQLLRYVTSSAHDADVKGYIFSHTIYHPGFVVEAFISRSYGGGIRPHPPGLRRPKKPGLNGI